MKDKDAHLMMEALKEGWADGLGDAVGGQRYSDEPSAPAQPGLKGNTSIVPSRLGIIPEKNYFIMYDWLGHFLKYLGNEKSAPANTHSDAIVADDPAEYYEVEWLDGMSTGQQTHDEPKTIWVYSAEKGMAKWSTEIKTPGGNVYPEPPTKPGELVGVASGAGGLLVTKLIVLDNMQQYRDYSNNATKNDILPQTPK